MVQEARLIELVLGLLVMNVSHGDQNPRRRINSEGRDSRSVTYEIAIKPAPCPIPTS